MQDQGCETVPRDFNSLNASIIAALAGARLDQEVRFRHFFILSYVSSQLLDTPPGADDDFPPMTTAALRFRHLEPSQGFVAGDIT